MKEHQQFWYTSRLGLTSMQGYLLNYSYPRHSHDEYTICVIEHGTQSFTWRGTKYYTPPSGLILINPGEVHTGEAATDLGFVLKSFYPTAEHVQRIASDLTGTSYLPNFPQVRVDDSRATRSALHVHHLLKSDADALETDSAMLELLVYLIRRYAEGSVNEVVYRRERGAVRQARAYLESEYGGQVRLDDLAAMAGLSPYHFLRVFKQEVGLSPHAYLQDVRIRRAQQLINAGRSILDAAFEAGFSSQSHLTRTFKTLRGTTPGRYARQIQSN